MPLLACLIVQPLNNHRMQALNFNLLEWAQRLERVENELADLKAKQPHTNSTLPAIASQEEFCRILNITAPTLRKGEKEGRFVRIMLSNGRIGYPVQENRAYSESKPPVIL